jgi:hypothetical protein
MIAPFSRGVGAGPIRRTEGWDPSWMSHMQWWRKSTAAVQVAAGKVAVWGDISGKGRSAAQTSGALQMSYELAVQNGQPSVTGADGCYMDVIPFTQAMDGTIYMICQFVTLAAAQIGNDDTAGGGGASPYPLPALGTSGANNRPTMLVGTGGSAVWGTGLTGGTPYLIKWAWDYTGAANGLYVQVNNGTEVSSTTTNEAVGSWNRLGFAGSVTVRAKILEDAGYSKRSTMAEDALWQRYAARRYSIAAM